MRLLTKKSIEIIREESGKTLQELAEIAHRSYKSPEVEELRREVANYHLPIKPSRWYDIRKYFR